MGAPALLQQLARFKGKQLIAAIDEIAAIAAAARFSVNVIDPRFNTGSIDNDPARLNIRTDGNSAITSFSIG